ncbi:MAG: DUF4435 domain-containing protein [Candidatus Thiodiazotropha lotti]|nr:DUF4435 domain-containing protein [Candidatus Thiodiazotropha lotti]MCW4218703.1 DUF4435 domain-containing protein [Candidatus Thiodiazotropha lotti]
MSMLNVHAAALSSKIASYHEFLSRFSKKTKVVYGFVEGKEDPCFYRGFVDHFLPDDYEVELWPAGNRDQVLRIHRDIDWRRFPKKRIVFFVDRDLTDLIPEKLPSDINIYITDKYSIENSISNRGTCRRMLTEVFGFSHVSHYEMDQVCDKFETEIENYFIAMIPIMARILFWRRSAANANLNNINIGKMMSVQDATLVVDESSAAKTARIEYLHRCVGIVFDQRIDISTELADFSKVSAYRNFVRGKYVMWFMVEFCKSVHHSATSFFSACEKPPKMKVSISTANAVTIIGNRTRVPQSFRSFILNTFCAYIDQKQA